MSTARQVIIMRDFLAKKLAINNFVVTSKIVQHIILMVCIWGRLGRKKNARISIV